MAETILHPKNPDECVAAVRDALADGAPLALRGHGTRGGFGRPVTTDRLIDLSSLSGILSHEPEELVLTVAAGTPMAEVEAALAAARQRLAFEPPTHGLLYGRSETGTAKGTVGGMVAAGLAGPRRVRDGSVRDHVLGIQAVNGRGELFRAGGKVVKNVTGYDVPKLMAGALGTLGLLTEITLKCLPTPEVTATLVWSGLDEATALELLGQALASPHEVSGAAHIPAEVAAACADPVIAGSGSSVTLVRLEGFAPSVDARVAAMGEAPGTGTGGRRVLTGAEAESPWVDVRDVAPFATIGTDAPETILWRVCVAQTAAPAVAGALRAIAPGARLYHDWGGGLIWLELPADSAATDLGASPVRAAVSAAGGGHATLIRAPEADRGRVPVFQPLPAPLAALTERMRESFDPLGILNPGRLHPPVHLHPPV